MARNNEPGMPKPKPTSGSNRWSEYNPHKNGDGPRWEAVDEAAILVALTNVTNAEGALLFGKTRDGGSLVVTLCAGELRKRFYATTPEEMAVHLRELADRA